MQDLIHAEHVHHLQDMPHAGDVREICPVLIVEADGARAIEHAADAPGEEFAVGIGQAATRLGDVAGESLDVVVLSDNRLDARARGIVIVGPHQTDDVVALATKSLKQHRTEGAGRPCQ